MGNPFYDALVESPPVSNQAQQVLDILDEFGRGVEQYAQNQVTINRERGFVVNMGQEWRVTIRSLAGGPEQPMFRAYVPIDGFPTMLDLHEQELLKCDSPEDVRGALQEFLRDPSVKEQIHYFQQR